MEKNRVSVIFFLALFFFSNVRPVFSQTLSADYLCEIGITFYQLGRYDDALHEFKKALIANPQHRKAKKFINIIYQEEISQTLADMVEQETEFRPSDDTKTKIPFKKEQVIDATLQDVQGNIKTGLDEERRKTQEKKEYSEELSERSEETQEKSKFKISGQAIVSLAIDSQDTIWKRSNYDLNEENYRALSNVAFDRRHNTYDPRIFDRLRLNLDTTEQRGWNFHSDITIDPWSFIGKTPKTTITSAFNDTAEIELKYWSNTGYIIGETVYTTRLGNSFSIPEVKVTNGIIPAFNAAGAFWPADSFSIPETKIIREFQPLRELWIGYSSDDFSVRFFPFAYQSQAFTSDDPLRLSNNHIWWEPSPWLYKWEKGIYNSGVAVPDFSKGYWNNSLASFTKDSDGQFLTALRGFSFSLSLGEDTQIYSAFATPKELWQDYSQVDNVISASRIKHYFGDNLLTGVTYTTRTGIDVDRSKVDSRNFVLGTDAAFEVKEGLKASLEVAASRSDYDLTNSQYRSKKRGNALYFSIIGRSPAKSIIDFAYAAIKQEKEESFLMKWNFFGAHMDEGFDPTLSTYRQTRDDTFWSRHIHFRRPFKYYSSGLYSSAIGWNDIEPFRIGNGIDIGRDVLGFRIEMDWKDKANNLFDIRNVHDVDGKFIENVVREELTYYINGKLTAKFLTIYHDFPKTKGNIDPYMIDSDSDRYLINTQILDAKEASLKTGSIGLEYTFAEWGAIHGIWERTNDYALAYDNFPRGILNSGSRSYTYWEYDNAYREMSSWLYEQGLFPSPPYPYYDIFRCGLRLIPLENLEIYLNYTRNEFESAGQISADMNHVGLELSYMPIKKIGIYFRYVYSRWKDLIRLRSNITDPRGHHNFFSELRYVPTENEELVLQYGESGYLPVGVAAADPFGGGMSILDTEHILRLYYRRRF